MKKSRRLIYLLVICLCFTPVASAQVEHKHLFKPKSEFPLKAEPAKDAAARREAFKARNEGPGLKALADELFGMMRLDWEPEGAELRRHFQAAVQAYQAGQHAEALEAYKRFFLQRVLDSKDGGTDPKARTFIEYFTEAEGLMKGRAKVAAFTKDYPADIAAEGTDAMIKYYRAGNHDAYHVLVDLEIGEPGEVNWIAPLTGYFGPTWHMPRDEAFLSFAYAGGDFFTSLLAAYQETGDVAYLQRWSAYVDDFHLHFLPSVQRTRWAYSLNWTNSPGPRLAPLIFVLRQRPETLDLLSAPTLVRSMLHSWKAGIPDQFEKSRSNGPNRRLTMNGRSLVGSYFAYPELAERDYLIDQRRRTLEDHPRVAIHPDGTDQILALPYFNQYMTTPLEDMADLEGKPEGRWMTERWKEEVKRTQNLVGSYLLRSLDPGQRQPGHRDPLRDIFRNKGMGDPKNGLAKLVPEMMALPENKALAEWHGGKRPIDLPIRAFAFPYGGFYYFWSDWSEQPQFMHFTTQRPGTRNRWRFNNNISFTAYGQLMLFYGAEDYVLEVDGVGGQAGVDIRSMPELVPQRNRFLSSAHFDFTEGAMTDDSRRITDAKTGKSTAVGPVEHRRQVLFVRDAGLWVLTDRVAGKRKHDFRILWPFRGDFEFKYGYQDVRQNIRNAPEDSYLHGYRPAKDFEFDAKNQAIRTINPNIPNLSIYHASDRPLTVTPGDIIQHDWRFANAVCTGPRINGAESATLASVIYPRAKGGEDLKSFVPVNEKGMVGFDAETRAGDRVAYRAASVIPTAMTLEQITAEGELLLVSRKSGANGQHGVLLGAKRITIDGKNQKLPGPDVVFTVGNDGTVTFEQIRYPMEMVKIEPASDRFVEKVEVVLSHPETDVDIRYTLDGSMPNLSSALYQGPIKVDKTTWVTAIAIRKGTKALVDSTDSTVYSLPHWAVYEKEALRKPALAAKPATAVPGMKVVYKETQQPISMFNLKGLPVTRSGVAEGLFDLSLRKGADPFSNYGFVYTGNLEVPKDGVYQFHAPDELVNGTVEAWSDLRLFINGEEWYPATRRQNFGVWSVPLAAGSHTIEVRWVDQRPSMGILSGDRPLESFTLWTGKVPLLELSGPDLPRGAVPAKLLWH